MDELERQTSTTTETETDVANIREFSLENQDIKLENLPRYEDLIAPQVQTDTKLDNMQEVENVPLFEPRKEKEEKKPTEVIHQKRFKIAVSTFAVIGVLLLSLVIINGVALALLKNDVNDNKKEITNLTQEVTNLQEQGFEIDGLTPDGADKVTYKLVLPRSYPDNTADLTWFDKLSIFLMKIFG